MVESKATEPPPGKPYNATERAKLILAEQEDQLYSFARAAARWNVHPKVAARRIKSLGLPLIRWNSRTAYVRLSDILRAEQAATVQE
jgi:hypothetical protein